MVVVLTGFMMRPLISPVFHFEIRSAVLIADSLPGSMARSVVASICRPPTIIGTDGHLLLETMADVTGAAPAIFDR